MTSDELDVFWRERAHWNRDGSYNCAADPRLFVPKRVGGGWTLNMALPKAQSAIWGFLLSALVLVIVVGVFATRA